MWVLSVWKHVSMCMHVTGCVTVWMNLCYECESVCCLLCSSVCLYSLDAGSPTHLCPTRPPAVRSGDHNALPHPTPRAYTQPPGPTPAASCGGIWESKGLDLRSRAQLWAPLYADFWPLAWRFLPLAAHSHTPLRYPDGSRFAGMCTKYEWEDFFFKRN